MIYLVVTNHSFQEFEDETEALEYARFAWNQAGTTFVHLQCDERAY